MSSFSEELESKCRRIVKKTMKQNLESTPLTYMVHEMALILDHLDSTRKQHTTHHKELREKELEIGSRILNIQERVDLIPNRMERIRLIDELKHRLEQIMTSAQRLNTESETALQQLQLRLLKLWNMYDQLSMEHGDTQDTA